MTEREREFLAAGFESCEGIERCAVVTLPTGREVRRVVGGWEVQPQNDNYWAKFDDLLEAMKYGTRGLSATIENEDDDFDEWDGDDEEDDELDQDEDVEDYDEDEVEVEDDDE